MTLEGGPKPKAGAQAAVHSGSEHAGSEHSGSEHSGSEHSGSEHAGSERSGSEHSGSEHSDANARHSDIVPRPREAPRYVVGIGASAGGLEALEQFFAALPHGIDAAFVIVVHLSPDFKSLMPELLAKRARLPIHTAESGMRLEPGHGYVIPPRKNMTVVDGLLQLQDQLRGRALLVHLPIDEFLESLAVHSAERAVAVILSGTGGDGSRGIRHIKDAGGVVFVQDPATAKFGGMPSSAIGTGFCDHTASPARLAERISRLIGSSPPDPSLANDVEAEPASVWEPDLAVVFRLLREKRGIDLSYYRRAMLRRRIQRRMTICNILDPGLYLERLASDPTELAGLESDVLIGVTSFFRDPEAFEHLQKHVLPELVKSGGEESPLRLWVTACSSGEEAYSLAMAALEVLEGTGSRRDLRVFATDVDEDSLERASRGEYAIGTMADVSAERIVKFFSRNGSSYLVGPKLRQKVVFAKHNLMRDVPFTRLDLVSCRNFLIYLEPQHQEQVLASLHYALRVGGALFLGNAESVAPYESEFHAVSSESRLFRKLHGGALPGMRRATGPLDPPLTPIQPRGRAAAVPEESYRLALERVCSARGETCVFLSSAGQVQDVVGDDADVLRVPPGKPALDILRVIKPAFKAPLSVALQRIQGGEGKASYLVGPGVPSNAEGPPPDDAPLELELFDLPESGAAPRQLLLVAKHPPLTGQSAAAPWRVPDTPGEGDQVRSLELRLRRTEDDLQATIEEQQSTNEELVAANEELHSTNEELQSVNEELHTVNAEYQAKNAELTRMAADWEQLLASVDLGVLLLDSRLTIRRFTPTTSSVVKLIERDVGRPITDFAHKLDASFVEDIQRVSATGEPFQRQVQTRDGAWLLMRFVAQQDADAPPAPPDLRPRSGVMITFTDVSEIKNSQEATKVMNQTLQGAVQRLEQQSKELEDVLSIVSHDVKRPVTAVDGLLALAQQEIAEAQAGSGSSAESLESARQLMADARKECNRMGKLLADLRRMTMLQKAQEAPERIELQPWLDARLASYLGEAETRGVQLQWTCDHETVLAPRLALEQALDNLVENAFHYGTGNQRPRVDVACSVEGEELRISVTDNGQGIAPEHHERVFELFRRLDPEAADGTGVGLVAVRRLVGRAGGKVTLSSSLGSGARFAFTLPVQRMGSPLEGGATSSRRLSVLIVEDDPLDVQLLEHALAQLRETGALKVDLCKVGTLGEAREAVKSSQFDLIVLDLSLPDGHGLGLLPDATMQVGVPVPTIVLSGHGKGLSADSMRSAGIVCCLDKEDLSDRSLGAAIESALNPTLRPSGDSPPSSDESQLP